MCWEVHVLPSHLQSTCWSDRKAALRIPPGTGRPTSAAATGKVPVYVRARGPGSGTSGFSPLQRNPFPVVHPWRWSGTTGDARETRFLDPAAGSQPGAVAPFPKRRLPAIRQDPFFQNAAMKTRGLTAKIIGKMPKFDCNLTTRSPRLRYPAGRGARFLSRLRKFAPSSLVDKGLRKQFGLGVA